MQIYDLSNNSPLVPVSSSLSSRVTDVNALGIDVLRAIPQIQDNAPFTFCAEPYQEVDSEDSPEMEEGEPSEESDLSGEGIEGSVEGDLSASSDQEDKQDEDPDWRIAGDI